MKLSKEELATLINSYSWRVKSLACNTQHIIKEIEELSNLTSRLDALAAALYSVICKERDGE